MGWQNSWTSSAVLSPIPLSIWGYVLSKYDNISVCAQLLSHVQLFVTPWTLVASVHGIFQARILEWIAISSSRGSSQPKDQTSISCVSCIGRQILYHCTTREAWGHIQFSSVAQSCPTLCYPMNCSTPGLPAHHQLSEFTHSCPLSR